MWCSVFSLRILQNTLYASVKGEPCSVVFQSVFADFPIVAI